MSKETVVGACIDCPFRRYRPSDGFGNGGGYCSADTEQRLVRGSPYGDRREQPEPPDWCPAREGIAIRFVKPSSLRKIANAYIPPKAIVREQPEHPDPGADEDADVFGSWWGPQGDIPF